MSYNQRPCDICKRPIWDGGHALNERECSQSGGEVCKLWQTVQRQAGALIAIKKDCQSHLKGEMNNGSFAARVEDFVRRGLDESIPAHTLYIQSWCGGEQSDYAMACDDRNRLLMERDAANRVVEAARKIAACTAGGAKIVFDDVPAEYGSELQKRLGALDVKRGVLDDAPRCRACKKVLEDCGCDGFQGVLGKTS